MERVSILTSLGLPQDFGKVLLVLSLTLLLAPYLAGTDFGVVKIPAFSDAIQRRLKIFGPILFVLVVLIHVPIVPGKKLSASLSGRWCGAWDEAGVTEVIDIAQAGSQLSGTSFFIDRFGNLKGGRAMVQGVVGPDGHVTFTLIRDNGLRFTLIGTADGVGGSLQVALAGNSPTYYTRPCPGLSTSSRPISPTSPTVASGAECRLGNLIECSTHTPV